MSPSKKANLLIKAATGIFVILLPILVLWFSWSLSGFENNGDSIVLQYALWGLAVLMAVFGIFFCRFLSKFFRQRQEQYSYLESQLIGYSARLTSFIENTEKVSIYSLDHDLCYTGFNSFHKKEMKEVFGADVAVGKPILPMLPQDFANRIKPHFDKAIKGEHFAVTNSFQDKYYTLVFNPVLDDQSQVIGFTCNIFDVSDRIKAELELEQYKEQLENIVAQRTQQLADQSEFFQKIIDSLPHLIFVRNKKHEYVLVNSAMADSMKRSPEEILGKNVIETHKNTEEAFKFQSEDDEILDKGTVFTEDAKHHAKDASNKWYHLDKRRMLVGEESFLLGVHHDITDLKETEIKLIQANYELKETLSRLKATQMRLVESEKMASLGQLTAGLAHEINNPINYLVGNIGPIRRDLQELRDLMMLPSDSQDEQFEKEFEVLFEELDTLLNGIDEGATRVRTLLADLNAFSLPETTAKKEADINQSILSTINLVKPQLKGKISLTHQLEGLPKVMCNEQQLRQTFLSLLTNAIQAIDGNGEIKISSKRQEDMVVVDISDTGVGISPEKLQRIFDPFYTTKEVGEGTGLGLSISYRAVADHNGSIEVRSKPGVGSTFTVFLPCT